MRSISSSACSSSVNLCSRWNSISCSMACSSFELTIRPPKRRSCSLFSLASTSVRLVSALTQLLARGGEPCLGLPELGGDGGSRSRGGELLVNGGDGAGNRVDLGVDLLQLVERIRFGYGCPQCARGGARRRWRVRRTLCRRDRPAALGPRDSRRDGCGLPSRLACRAAAAAIGPFRLLYHSQPQIGCPAAVSVGRTVWRLGQQRVVLGGNHQVERGQGHHVHHHGDERAQLRAVEHEGLLEQER